MHTTLLSDDEGFAQVHVNTDSEREDNEALLAEDLMTQDEMEESSD